MYIPSILSNTINMTSDQYHYNSFVKGGILKKN